MFNSVAGMGKMRRVGPELILQVQVFHLSKHQKSIAKAFSLFKNEVASGIARRKSFWVSFKLNLL